MRFMAITFMVFALGAADGCSNNGAPKLPQGCPDESDDDQELALEPRRAAAPRAETGGDFMTQASRSTADGTMLSAHRPHAESLAVADACQED